jgi:hypothetical protein
MQRTIRNYRLEERIGEDVLIDSPSFHFRSAFAFKMITSGYDDSAYFIHTNNQEE